MIEICRLFAHRLNIALSVVLLVDVPSPSAPHPPPFATEQGSSNCLYPRRHDGGW